MKSNRHFVFVTLIVTSTLLVMSGACSEHQPGPYEGGGRTFPTSVIGGSGETPPQPDSGGQQDTFVPPDVAKDTTNDTSSSG